MAKHQILVFVAVVLAVALAFPASVSGARVVGHKKSKCQFVVRGRIFCDTCLAGFETLASTYIAGAKVKVECRSKSTGAKTYSIEGVTDHTGTYNIPVIGDHEHENCEAILGSSSHPTCKVALQGRERAPVFLTENNGIASDVRFANSLGFQTDSDSVLPACAELLKTFEQTEV